MNTWRHIVTLCASLLVVSSLAWGQTWERYLERYRGPYRGQVVDADTKAPLVGAVVVAMWTRDRVYPFHSVNERYAVREVVTDSEGRFVLEARDIEETAPKRTLHPEFRIFMLGYGAFPRHHRAPQGFIEGIFWGAGTAVELPFLDARKPRIESLRSVDPYNFSEQPFEELPQLMRAFNQERIALGLEPLPPPEKKQ